MVGNPFVIRKEHVNQVANIMFQTYRDYPLWHYLIPDDEDFEKSHSLWRSQILYGTKFGYVITSSSNFEGVLVMVHSKYAIVPVLKEIRCGGLRIIKDMGFKFASNSKAITKILDENRLKILGNNEYWYIFYVAVLPNEQNKGYGRSMMDFVYGLTKDSGLPYCLETAKEVNVEIYQKMGFIVKNHCLLGDTGVHSWLMVRETQ